MMQHARSLDDLHLQKSWLTVGVFDGVHRGHQAIIRKLVSGAHAHGSPAVVLTFFPHPASVLGHRDLKCLTTSDERASLLEALGVDALVTHLFDETVANTTAYDFMAKLKARSGLEHLLMGYDFALGKGREGNAMRLAEIGRKLDYTVDVVDAVGDESGVISSTAIRRLIVIGNVSEAANLLGRPYSLSGRVIHGDGRGKTIGIPTANIAVPAEKALPANGVYACFARVDGQELPAVSNIGLRPTFPGGDPLPHVEAHIMDFEADLYDHVITLEFAARLRDERKFPSVEALITQISADIETARMMLKTSR
jgi:riboflavin kinase/FMN adenylyltransferase